MSDPQIERLKKADKANQITVVVSIIGELLEESFERSIKLVVEGSKNKKDKNKNLLLGGVFNKRYADAFWNSDLPLRFGKRFATHLLYANDFWRSCFEQDDLPIATIEQIVSVNPESLCNGIRRNRVFLMLNKWGELRAKLGENNLSPFIQQCDLIIKLDQDATERIEKEALALPKLSNETLILHFSVWLEKMYYATPDDRDFEQKIDQYREVLEFALRETNKNGINTKPKDEIEINKQLEKLVKAVFKNSKIEFDTFSFFYQINDYLNTTWQIEMFASQGWSAQKTEERITVIPTTSEQKQAWDLGPQKFHAMDCFEMYLPTSGEDIDFFQSVQAKSPNEFSALANIQLYTGNRFLRHWCGNEAMSYIYDTLGFRVENALRTLECNKGCYTIQFVKPRCQLKQSGEAFNRVFLANGRLALEARPAGSFIKMASEFEGTRDIETNELKNIYDFFSANIHDEKTDLSSKLFLNSGKCELLLTRFFSGDIKSFIFNHCFLGKNKVQKLISTRFEEGIEINFQGKGFNTLLGKKLGENGKNGEIDVLAYRDNTLFIIEAKVTYDRTTASQMTSVSNALSKGSEQITRVLEQLENYWPEIHSNIDAPSDLSSIRIIPLLVSNSFEYDHCYFGPYLKISEFELRMLFIDQPNYTKPLHLLHQGTFSRDGTTDKTTPPKDPPGSDQEREAYQVFKTEHPTVDQLIDGIERSLFWQKVFDREFALTPVIKK